MTKLQRQVLEFHRVFGHPTADSPTIPSDERVRFRAAFIVEECLEFLEACFDKKSIILGGGPREPKFDVDFELGQARNIFANLIAKATVKVDLPLAVDALADIDYVVEGTRLEFGVNGEPIADEVHRANMTKVGGKRTPEGKTMKPPGWTPPDIEGCLERQKLKPPYHRHSKESLGDEIAHNAEYYDKLKEIAREMPAMTLAQRAEQRLDWAYGNLAIDGKASRSAFKIIATTTVDEGLGWTPEQFDAWAEGKKWDAP